jgi:hypothetical protein
MDTFKYAIGYQGSLHRFDGQTREIVFHKVVDFMKKNNINYSSSDLLRAIDRQSGIQTQSKKIGFNEAMLGAMALIKFTAGKSTSPAEINRRSAICSACPLSNQVGGCFSCGVGGKIAKAVAAIRAKKGSGIPIPSEVKSKFCGFCKCALPMLVVTRMEDFHPETNQLNQTRPDNCWQKKTSTNFSNE